MSTCSVFRASLHRLQTGLAVAAASAALSGAAWSQLTFHVESGFNTSNCYSCPAGYGVTGTVPQTAFFTCWQPCTGNTASESVADRGLLYSMSEDHAFCGCTTLGTRSWTFVPDLIISGPATANWIPVSFNLVYDGSPLSTYVDIYAEFGGPSPFGCVIHPPLNPAPGVLVSSTALLPVGTPLGFLIRNTVAANAYFQTNTYARSEAVVHLPTVGPVFNLPSGYTVDCPELNIVNNHWMGTELRAFVFSDPESRIAGVGADVVMNVSATGLGLQYQWRRNGVALSDGATANGSSISGATTSQLSIDDVDSADAGAYDCVVTATHGTDTSMAATLTVDAPTSYGTAKTNSLGCVPMIGSVGFASATASSPFLVTESNVLNGRSGLMFYGHSPASQAFQGGFKLVGGSLRRTVVQDSGGSPIGVSDCTGSYAYDMNARIQSGIDATLIPGADIYCQFWSRDPADPHGSGLSDALQFVVGH